MKNLLNKWITKDQTTRLYETPVPIIGLTGGIATGKSTTAQLFRDAGVPVIDADKLVKSIYQKRESYEFVLKHFPAAITDNDIHFKTLREVAFTTAENQLLIETFIYAQMPQAFKEAYLAFPEHKFIVYDVPLLFEKGLDAKVDISICTYAPRSLQIQRLIKRDNISTELAEKILTKQMDIEEKKTKSDLFIDNTKSKDELKKSFDALMITLTG